MLTLQSAPLLCNFILSSSWHRGSTIRVRGSKTASAKTFKPQKGVFAIWSLGNTLEVLKLMSLSLSFKANNKEIRLKDSCLTVFSPLSSWWWHGTWWNWAQLKCSCWRKCLNTGRIYTRFILWPIDHREYHMALFGLKMDGPDVPQLGQAFRLTLFCCLMGKLMSQPEWLVPIKSENRNMGNLFCQVNRIVIVLSFSQRWHRPIMFVILSKKILSHQKKASYTNSLIVLFLKITYRNCFKYVQFYVLLTISE